MSIGYALFFSIVGGYLALLIISFWAKKLSTGLSAKGTLLTGLFSCIASFLFLLFAPETLLVPVVIIFMGLLMLTLIVFWIDSL